MGWKNVKEHYKVEHTVQVTEDGICIGSPYIHNIIVIGDDGKVKKRYENGRTNEDLRRIQDEIDADPAMLRKMVLTADTFDNSITVYTYDDGEIIECKCEELGFPNVTHGGSIMYDNSFSTNKVKVVKWAKESAGICVKWAKESVDSAEKDLLEKQARLTEQEYHLARLEKEYPENTTAP